MLSKRHRNAKQCLEHWESIGLWAIKSSQERKPIMKGLNVSSLAARPVVSPKKDN